VNSNITDDSPFDKRWFRILWQVAEKVVIPKAVQKCPDASCVCEVPFTEAPEILRNATYLSVRRNDLPC
jgi:hypothetical protein